MIAESLVPRMHGLQTCHVVALISVADIAISNIDGHIKVRPLE
jgi:hypothetical protein